MTHEQELEGYILQGMAHAIWVHAFIQWATEIDLHVDKGTWEEEAGATPSAAMQSAQELAGGIAALNTDSVAAMFLTMRGHIRPRHSEMRATEADRAVAFGGDVALSCLGTLDVPEFARYNLPEMKTKIEVDRSQHMDLSWEISGDERPVRRNPCNPGRPEMSLRQFAADVNAELPYITPEVGDGAKGRFGDRKVFIGALWRQFRTSPAFDGMTLEQFKDRLVEAQKQRLLVLARADLVSAMDPKEVAQSEWVDPDGGRSYHFVVDQSVP
jgi:hypothetical protein